MNEQQLADRLTQAGAFGVANRGYAVDAMVAPKVRLRFLRSKTAPAGWECAFERWGHLSDLRPVRNAADVDARVLEWQRADRRDRYQLRRATVAERRRARLRNVDWMHADAAPGWPAGTHRSLSGRGNALAMMLGIANEVAGTNALRSLVRDHDLPGSLLQGLPERAGPGRRDVLMVAGAEMAEFARIPIDPRGMVILDDTAATKAFREALRAGTIQTVQPTSPAHAAWLEAGGWCSIEGLTADDLDAAVADAPAKCPADDR